VPTTKSGATSGSTSSTSSRSTSKTKTNAKRTSAKRSSRPTAKRNGRVKPSSAKTLKDPKGGLTAAGRAHFRKTEGANLKPGVKGKVDTPEKMKRKGSFLRRHFANPRGPMVDETGEPTRLAKSAHAWGEPIPKTKAAARKLADKGKKLLDQYAERNSAK
jgi:Domain of unknown function (DUF6321)